MKKLVRDKIPEIITQNWEKCEFYICSDDEYFQSLKEKVVEESKEILDSKNDKELIEEIADLYEVIDTIISNKKLNLDDIKNIQSDKKNIRWGFGKRIILTQY